MPYYRCIKDHKMFKADKSYNFTDKVMYLEFEHFRWYIDVSGDRYYYGTSLNEKTWCYFDEYFITMQQHRHEQIDVII